VNGTTRTRTSVFYCRICIRTARFATSCARRASVECQKEEPGCQLLVCGDTTNFLWQHAMVALLHIAFRSRSHASLCLAGCSGACALRNGGESTDRASCLMPRRSTPRHLQRTRLSYACFMHDAEEVRIVNRLVSCWHLLLAATGALRASRTSQPACPSVCPPVSTAQANAELILYRKARMREFLTAEAESFSQQLQARGLAFAKTRN